jgi:hypothetical protein
MKSGNLNFLEPSGPLQACDGTDLPFYNYITNTQYNYFISNKGLLKERCKEVNVAVTGAAAAASPLKRILQNSLSNVTYLPGHRQAGAPMINIQSTLRNAQNVSLQFYLVTTVIHIQSLRSQISDNEIYLLINL